MRCGTCSLSSPSRPARRIRSFRSFEQRADAHVRGDVHGLGAADLLLALLLGVREPVARVDAEAREVELVLLLVVLLARLPLHLALVALELALRDPVVRALVGDEGLVVRRHRSGGELLAPGADRHVEVDLRQLVLALALERAGQLQRDRALELRRRGAGGLQLGAQVQVHLAAVDLLLAAEGLVDQLLGALVRAAVVAAAGRQRERGTAQDEHEQQEQTASAESWQGGPSFRRPHVAPASLQAACDRRLRGKRRSTYRTPLPHALVWTHPQRPPAGRRPCRSRALLRHARPCSRPRPPARASPTR